MSALESIAVGEDRPRAAGMGPWILRRLCRRLTHGSVTIIFPNGGSLSHQAPEPGPHGTITLHRWRALFRLLSNGDVSFSESYIDGEWSSPDVVALLEMAALNMHTIGQSIAGTLPARVMNRVQHWIRANTKSGSKRNIVEHYDLGNAFYAAWLDPGMTYSSGIYPTEDATLAEAQATKLDRVVELLEPKPGQRVLEIGFGWGGVVERLAGIGASVTGLTLSPSQLAHATSRLEAAGLADRADLRLQDYRDAEGLYDRIVSIEMIEAVGEAYWPVYFGVLSRLLAPGGAAVLQVITIAEDRFETYRRQPDFIQRHIFPGGMLPSPTVLRQRIEGAGLRVESLETFGASYARTLHDWRQRFDAAWPEIARMGFPMRFRRLWDYYLQYCEAGFRTGAIDVGLWRLSRAR